VLELLFRFYVWNCYAYFILDCYAYFILDGYVYFGTVMHILFWTVMHILCCYFVFETYFISHNLNIIILSANK
jgi:hypothetical protein